MNDLPWGVQFPFEAQESRSSTPILLLDVVSVSNEAQEKFASGNLAHLQSFNLSSHDIDLSYPTMIALGVNVRAVYTRENRF